MPWKVRSIVDERVKFIGRVLEGEKMVELCREFGISRKTGYKIWDRYQKVGLHGLTDRSRRPVRYAHQLPMQLEKAIVGIKKNRPSWGAPKIRALLMRKYPEVKPPAKSTVHAVLDRHGLVKRRRKRRFKAEGTPLSLAKRPNDLWCADYKGEFMLESRRYCYPLTITDFQSRYILSCEALGSNRELYAFHVFERVFKEYGLPERIRSDNGTPFASKATAGLSRLSMWWIRLGILPERIQAGQPQQNGRHERMHRTLKQETTKPPAPSMKTQQRRFEVFQHTYNHERPHEALQQTTPASHSPCFGKIPPAGG